MFYVTIHSPRGTARLPRETKAEAQAKAEQVRASGLPVSIETEDQKDRATAPMFKQQPKRIEGVNYVDGWDV